MTLLSTRVTPHAFQKSCLLTTFFLHRNEQNISFSLGAEVVIPKSLFEKTNQNLTKTENNQGCKDDDNDK